MSCTPSGTLDAGEASPLCFFEPSQLLSQNENYRSFQYRNFQSLFPS